MASCAICLATDPGYLFPTLVAAIQARHYACVTKAEVFVFCFGADSQAERIFTQISKAEGIHFCPKPRATIENEPVALARLFLDRLVPDEFDQLLYMDGDIQITASLDPLIDKDPAPSHFMAANDPISFMVEDSEAVTRYFASIGLPPVAHGTYFNSGVLRINRIGWDEIGLAAWAAWRAGKQLFRFHDQDAINLVATDQRIAMPLSWNFPIFMRNARVEIPIQPRVTHFMSAPKPWQGAFLPWSKTSVEPYLELIRKYPALASYRSILPFGSHVRYRLQQQYKAILEYISWGFGKRHQRILDYEAWTNTEWLRSINANCF